MKTASKAMARDVQGIMAQSKIPAPDLAPVIARQKVVFASNAAIIADSKNTVAQLKRQLDEEAALYRSANKFRTPDINRRQLSGTRMSAGGGGGGQWGHLAGTQFEGGPARGGGKGGKGSRFGGNAYAAGVAWNAGQDIAQGGLAAVANNVPQIIQLVTSSPALKAALAAGGAAAAAILSTVLAGWSYKKNVHDVTGGGFDAMVDKKQTAAKAEAASRQLVRDQQKASASSAKTSGIAADNHAGAGGLVDATTAAMQRGAAAIQERRDLTAQIRREEIEAIEDPAARAKALAEEEKKELRDKLRLQGELVGRALELARVEEAAAESRMKALRAEWDMLTKQAPTPADRDKRAALQTEIPAVQSRLDDARARSSSAGQDLDHVRSRAALVPMEDKIIDLGRDRELAGIKKDAAAKNAAEAERLSMQEAEGRQAYADAVEKWRKLWKDTADAADATRREVQEKSDAKQKQKGEMQEQLEIGELQAGGGSRRAKKMERARDLRNSTEKFKEAGFDKPGEAAALAGREQRMNDRRENPRSIRGAGFGGASPDRVSGLDYFKGTAEERRMGTPQTSKTDKSNFEQRRAIPGVGGKVDKNLAEKEAADAKKNSEVKPDSNDRVAKLLENILNALTSRPAGAAAGS